MKPSITKCLTPSWFPLAPNAILIQPTQTHSRKKLIDGEPHDTQTYLILNVNGNYVS